MSTLDMVGKHFVLWRVEYFSKAYRDQAGIYRDGYIVYEQIPVTIIETKKVHGMWSGGEYDGWKAVSENGEEFTNNWTSFPDDSMTPTYFWDARKDERGLWQPVNGLDAYNSIHAYVNENGTRAVPIGATICEKHDYASIEGGCYKCDLERLHIERQNNLNF